MGGRGDIEDMHRTDLKARYWYTEKHKIEPTESRFHESEVILVRDEPQQGQDTGSEVQATTSAELKLLRLRLTLLSPGRADFVAGTTTAEAFVVIQASEAAPPRLRVAALATSLSDDTWVGCGLFDGISVGNLDGTGEGGGFGRRVDTGCG